MVKVNGKPVLEHLVNHLNKAGITEIIVNLHYLQDMMTNHLQDNVLYFYEPRLLGHRGTILALRKWLEHDDFLVVNADTLSSLNYTVMIQNHKPGMITAFMDENRAAGTWIYSQEYFNDLNLPINPYRDPLVTWFDLGTKDRLEAAKQYYEK